MPRRDQTITISAAARIRADAAAVFEFLAAPDNHRRLQVAGIRLLTLDDGAADLLSGGEIVLEGPVGIRRVAHTRVTLSQPPYRLAGAARLDSGTEAHVSWTLRPSGDGAVDVELTAVLGPIAVADRPTLALGGRRWVRGRFERTLRRVAAELERGPLPAAAADSTPTPALRARGRGVTQPA
jgi:uncharacterized protein YndB with AHSA1/START domain